MENKKDENLTTSYEKTFKTYTMVPTIVTAFFAIACFVLGIVLACEDEAFWLPVMWFGGAVYCVLTYFFLKIIMSASILQVLYLKQIATNSEKSQDLLRQEKSE